MGEGMGKYAVIINVQRNALSTNYRRVTVTDLKKRLDRASPARR